MDAFVLGADEGGLDVKGSGKVHPPIGEAEVLHHGPADVAHAHQNSGEAALHAEYARDLRTQCSDVVAIALLSKFAEAVEILPDLRGGKPQQIAKLPGRNFVNAALAQLVQLAQIARQATDDVVGHLDSLHFSVRPFKIQKVVKSIT